MSGTKNYFIWETQPAQRGVVIRNALATMQGKPKRVVQKLRT